MVPISTCLSNVLLPVWAAPHTSWPGQHRHSLQCSVVSSAKGREIHILLRNTLCKVSCPVMLLLHQSEKLLLTVFPHITLSPPTSFPRLHILHFIPVYSTEVSLGMHRQLGGEERWETHLGYSKWLLLKRKGCWGQWFIVPSVLHSLLKFWGVPTALRWAWQRTTTLRCDLSCILPA